MELVLPIIAVSAVGLMINTKPKPENFTPLGKNEDYSKNISVPNPVHINRNDPISVNSLTNMPSSERNLPFVRAPENIYFTNGGPTSQVMDASEGFRQLLGGVPEDRIEKQAMVNDVKAVIKENEQKLNTFQINRSSEYSKVLNQHKRDDELPELPDFSATIRERGDRGLNSGTFSLDDLKKFPTNYVAGNSRPVEELDKNRVVKPGIGSVVSTHKKQTNTEYVKYYKDRTIQNNRVNTPGNPEGMSKRPNDPIKFTKRRDQTIETRVM